MSHVRDDKIILRIALVLKELREEYGVSQEDVYNDINIHVGRIESGHTNPTISTLSALAKYFNLSLADLFRRVESRPERRH